MNAFYDAVIIGAGVAGLSALLGLDRNQRVALINPGSPLQTGSSWRAQGGVAVALARHDSPRLHAADTMRASRHLAVPAAVEVLTEEGPERVLELLRGGMTVDRDAGGELLFGLEAAHSRSRVIHHKDHTGRSLVGYLWREASKRRRLDHYRQRAARLLTHSGGIGGVLLDGGEVLATPRVILATGGFAGLYEATTTGREVRGDGLVLAADAGAHLRDLEFVQFHPTALDVETDGPLPLLTEALRGGGAKLRLEDGSRFVEELKPRDEVARAIAAKRREGHTVFLDLRPVERCRERFPGAYGHQSRLAAETGLLPVRPAAHYTIGGVVTDLDGQTGVPGLYACGEVASVGVHGANRLASNSLLEGLVFGRRAGRHCASALRSWSRPPDAPPLGRLESEPALKEFRRRFEESVGVVRSAESLVPFLEWTRTQPRSLEMELGRRVALAALRRTESVGAHYRADSQGQEKLEVAG